MTVGELRMRISNQEFTEWHVYFAKKAQRQELEHKKQSGKK